MSEFAAEPPTIETLADVKEALNAVCAITGAENFESFLSDVASRQEHSWSPCVQVWSQGTIAYRCKTCQMTPASAVCPTCFKAGGHENHDYVMYHSESGGCCDCGDLSSWKYSGCCPSHRPPPAGSERDSVNGRLEPEPEALMRELLGLHLGVVILRIKAMALLTSGSTDSGTREGTLLALDSAMGLTGLSSLKWLQRCCSVTQLRILAVEEICRPLSEAEPSRSPFPSESTIDGFRQSRRNIARRILCLRPKTPVAQGQAEAEDEESLLSEMMQSFAMVRDKWLSDITTLVMVMLYDTDFKYRFSRCLCKYYTGIIMETPSNEYLSTTLDRLTVQLFSIPSITLRLVKEDRLLEAFMGALRTGLEAARPNGTGCVVPDSDCLNKDRLHLRVLLDLKMILCHRSVTAHLLLHQPEALRVFLDSMQLMQGMCPQKRELDQHIAQESTQWIHGIVIEEQMLQVVATMVECLCNDAVGADDPEASAQLSEDLGGGSSCQALDRDSIIKAGSAAACLAAGAEAALKRLCAWALEANHPSSISSIGQELIGGAPVSLHLPLHRVAGAFLQGLLLMADGSSQEAAAASEAFRRLMEGSWLEKVPGAENLAVEGGTSAAAWRLVAMHPVRILVWLAQIRARLWVRNGTSMLHLEMYYRNVFWRDVALDVDHLLLQVWLAAVPGEHKCQAMASVLEAFGAQPLLHGMATITNHGGDSNSPLPKRMEDHQLQCAASGIRLLVTLLRESHIACSPRAKLKHQMMHHLAVSNKGYNLLNEVVTHGMRNTALFDSVLAEVAEYVDPDLKSHGHYKLRKHCWAKFDPLFLHFQGHELQEALERAQASGEYRPWMHLYPQDPLPSNLQGALDLLLSRSCMLLEWACLRYAELYPSNASAELSWSALHLLSLALRMTGAGGRRPLTPDGDPKLVGPVKGRTHLVSMLSGRDHHCRPGGLATLQAVLSTQESAADIRSAAEHLLPELQVLAQQARDEEDENTEGCEKTDRGDNIHVPPASLPLPTSKMDTFHATVGAEAECTRHGKAQAPAAATADDVRRRKARQRQEEVMRRMAVQQATFLAGECDKEDEEAAGAGTSDADMYMQDDEESGGASPSTCRRVEWVEPPGGCVYCHLDDAGAGPLGGLCHVQANAVPAFAARVYPDRMARLASAMANERGDSSSPWTSEENMAGAEGSSDHFIAHGPMVSKIDLCTGLATLSCGHMMHHSCFERFCKDRQRMEYLCPICRRLSNSILPAAGPGSAEICPPTASRQNSLQRWCTSVLDNLPSSRGAGCHKAWLHALQGSLPPDVPRGMGLADPRHAEHVRKGTWQERLGSRGAMTSKFLKCCWFAVYRKAKLEVYEHSRRVQKIRARNRRAAGGRLQGDAFHADHGEGGVEDGLHNEDDRGAAGDNVEAVGEEWSAQTLETAHRHRQELSNVPPSAVAWALLAHNLAHWEVLQRPTVERGNPGPTPSTSSDNCSNHDPMVRAAYWRSLRGIAAVCAAAGTEISKWEEPDPGTAPSTPLMTKKRLLCALVEWVAGGPDASLDPCASSAPVGILRALLRELQEVKGMSPHQPLPDQPTLGDMLRDPFLVLLELLAMAAELTTALEDSLKWVLPVVYVMAAAQAAVASVSSYHHQGSSAGVEGEWGEVRRLLSFQESGDSPAGDASTASEQLVRAVSVQLRPLLVRAAALRALLAGQSEPEDLVDSGGAEYLAASLGLPSAREALALVHLHPHRAAVLGRWCPQLSCRAPGNPPPPTPDRALRVPRPLARPGLMPMPQLYRHMFLALEDSVCDHCGCHPTEPVLCLLTGAFLCCDSHSGCLSHAWLHGAGTGVYLLIKATQLLIVRNGERACNDHPSLCLYLDSHGEEDVWMRRGRALHLSEPRYRRISALWSSGALDFDTSILFASFQIPQGRLYPSAGGRRGHR